MGITFTHTTFFSSPDLFNELKKKKKMIFVKQMLEKEDVIAHAATKQL